MTSKNRIWHRIPVRFSPRPGTTHNNRAGLDQALAAVWDGSVFTVTKFDRFARNMESGANRGRQC